MPAPVVAGTATDTVSSSSDTSLDPAAPGGTGGHIIIVGGCLNSRTLTASGFTQQLNFSDSGGYRIQCWTKADAGESTFNITQSATFGEGAVGVLRITGADLTSVVNATPAGSGDTSDADRSTVEAPGLTTVADNSLVLWFYVSSGGQNVPSAPSGVTEVIDLAGVNGTSSHIWVGSKAVTTAGAEAGKVITKSSFGHWAAGAIALSPTGGAGAVGDGVNVQALRRTRSKTLLRR